MKNSAQRSLMGGATAAHDWNAYQQKIFDWALDVASGHADSQHAQIIARAGTGKTTTALEIARIVRQCDPNAEALFTTFSRDLADELEGKLSDTPFESRTLNSLGFKIVQTHFGNRRYELTNSKYYRLIDDWAKANYRHFASENWRETKDAIKTLVDFGRMTHVDPTDHEALKDMANKHSIMLGDWWKGLSEILDAGEELVEEKWTLDFNDQIWLPWRLDMAMPSYDWVMVDEAQDLNLAQRWIIEQVIAEDGHAVWIGDPAQSIFQWRAATPKGFVDVKDNWGASQFRLPLSYRCPESHVREARRIVDDFESDESTGEGTIECYPEAEFADKVRLGDVVLSRRNAPMMRKALWMIEHRRPANVKGRSLKQNLTTVIDTVEDRLREDGRLMLSDEMERQVRDEYPELFQGADPGEPLHIPSEIADRFEAEDMPVDYSLFPQYLERWAEQKIEKLQDQGASEGRILMVVDQRESLMACHRGYEQVSTLAGLREKLSDLFLSKDAGEADMDAIVTFMTIHKAKGKGFERVHLIDTDSLPLDFEGVDHAEEMNVKYVALTRSEKYLGICGELWGERENTQVCE